MTPAERAEAEAGLRALRARIEELSRKAHRGERESFSVRVTENEINLLLETDQEVRRRMRQHGVEEVYVVMDAGRVACAARRREAGAPVTVTAAVTPRVRPDGSLDLQIEGVGIGRLSVPTALSRRWTDRATDALSGQRLGAGIDLVSLRVEKGAIVVDGQIGPHRPQ